MLFQNKKISFPKIKIMSRDKCKIDLLSAPLIILCPKWCKKRKKIKVEYKIYRFTSCQKRAFFK